MDGGGGRGHSDIALAVLIGRGGEGWEGGGEVVCILHVNLEDKFTTERWPFLITMVSTYF